MVAMEVAKAAFIAVLHGTEVFQGALDLEKTKLSCPTCVCERPKAPAAGR